MEPVVHLSLCKLPKKIVKVAWSQCGLDDAPLWMMDDQSFPRVHVHINEVHREAMCRWFLRFFV